MAMYSPLIGKHYLALINSLSPTSPTGFEPVLPERKPGVLGLTRRWGLKVGRLGLEPRTNGLKVHCSTD